MFKMLHQKKQEKINFLGMLCNHLSSAPQKPSCDLHRIINACQTWP